MRRGLRRALGATVVMTVVVWAWDARRATGPEKAVVRPVEAGRAEPASRVTATTPLPPALPDVEVEAARRNPFSPAFASPAASAATAAVVPAPVAPPQAAVAPLPLPPPPPPPPPPMQWRYFGRIQTPDGRSLLLIVRPGAQPVVAQSGLALSDGYRIDEVTTVAIRIGHSSHSVAIDIQIPAVPAP